MIPEDNSSNQQCCICPCDPKAHLVYFKCPILSGEAICQWCCQTECLKDDIAVKFSQTLGKEITLEQVNEACKTCGNNYAKQNKELAAQLEKDNEK